MCPGSGVDAIKVTGKGKRIDAMIRSKPEELIRQNIARFVETELLPQAQDLDNKGEFPMALFQKLAAMGIFGIRYPAPKAVPAATIHYTALSAKNWPGA